MTFKRFVDFILVYYGPYNGFHIEGRFFRLGSGVGELIEIRALIIHCRLTAYFKTSKIELLVRLLTLCDSCNRSDNYYNTNYYA